MSALTTTPDHAVTPAEHAEAILGRALNAARYVGPRLILAKPLRPGDRASLTGYLADLRARDVPAGPDFVAAGVSKLFAAFTTAPPDLDDVKAKLAVYAAALKDQPRFAVAAVLTGIARGEFGALRFVPTPAEMAVWAAAKARPLREDVALITRVLDAKADNPVPPAERERMAGRFDALLAELRALEPHDDRRFVSGVAGPAVDPITKDPGAE